MGKKRRHRMKATNSKAFNLRMPQDLREWLEREARKNLRSLNSEIIFKLLRSKGCIEAGNNRNPGQRST